MEFNFEGKIELPSRSYEGRVGFAIGTGRCGTKFLSNVIASESGILSVHERNPLNEAFHRYCKWYKLPVDDEGFLNTKDLEIRQDLADHKFSFEASAHLSLSVRELYSRFGAKFILLVRSPERVVNSYLRKGWYDKPIIYSNSELALGYQKSKGFHHFLGRIVPTKEKFLQWNVMSRVGKLAWYWNILNAKVLEQFEDLPKTHWRIEKLENLTYDRYLEITKFLGFQSTIKRQTYDKIKINRPNIQYNVPTIASWNIIEIDEFEREVKPLAEILGYEYRVDHLPIPEHITSSVNKSLTNKPSIKSLIARILRRLNR
jgi:hypothetical protein